jgi:AcrR family transcriptional regulator
MTSSTGERRERRDAQRNQIRVLQAARELFAEQGANTTIEEVARRAGVGVGTVYRCFATKHDLYTAVSREVCDDLHKHLSAVTACSPDPFEQLRVMFYTHYQRHAAHAVLFEFAEQQQLFAVLQVMLVALIQHGQQHGLMRMGDPQVLAGLCLELLTPHTIHRLVHLCNGSPHEAAEAAFQFAINGLRICPTNT